MKHIMNVVGRLFIDRITIALIMLISKDAIEMYFHPQISAIQLRRREPRVKPAKYKAPNNPITSAGEHSIFIVTIQLEIEFPVE